LPHVTNRGVVASTATPESEPVSHPDERRIRPGGPKAREGSRNGSRREIIPKNGPTGQLRLVSPIKPAATRYKYPRLNEEYGMLHTARNVIVAFTLGSALGVPFGVVAKSSDHRTFGGKVVHISGSNIKVTGVEGGKTQTLSFLMVPHIKKTFKRKGATTAALQTIKVGDFVVVTFDQKLLGVRHADEILDSDAPLGPMKS
jgi:hypothetical protein